MGSGPHELVTVLVQGVPGRGLAWELSKLFIEASDIGERYELLLHPPGATLGEHFLYVLRRALDAPTELVLRLEDDAIVNQHVLHNLSTWPALRNSDFGAGWAFAPVTNRGRWPRREIHGSVGVLLKSSLLPEIVERCAREFHDQPDRLDQDLVLSRAVRDSGYYVYLHDPPLVEHPIDVPSTMNHKHTRATGTTSGRFNASWRRATLRAAGQR